jgi:hypothetical protein
MFVSGSSSERPRDVVARTQVLVHCLELVKITATDSKVVEHSDHLKYEVSKQWTMVKRHSNTAKGAL